MKKVPVCSESHSWIAYLISSANGSDNEEGKQRRSTDLRAEVSGSGERHVHWRLDLYQYLTATIQLQFTVLEMTWI